MSHPSPAMKMATQIALSNRQCYMDYMAAARRAACEVPGFCRTSLWDVSSDVLEGDYDLDDALALKLVTELLPKQPRGSAQQNMLEAYLLGGPSGEIGSAENAIGNAFDVSFGPRAILGNAAGVTSVHNAHYATQTARAIEQAQQHLLAGRMSSIRINDSMTLYNANKSGRGRPRLRIKINKMPLRFVAPAFGMENLRELRNANTAEMLRKNVLPRWYAKGGLSAAMRGDMPQRMGEMARNVVWSGEARFQFLRKDLIPALAKYQWLPKYTRTNGILAAAPSAAIDLYNSYDQETGGINWHKFGINSVKSQSGNAVGAVSSMLIGAGVAAGFGLAVTAAPVVLAGLVGGVIVQFLWGVTGAADYAGSIAERALGRQP